MNFIVLRYSGGTEEPEQCEYGLRPMVQRSCTEAVARDSQRLGLGGLFSQFRTLAGWSGEAWKSYPGKGRFVTRSRSADRHRPCVCRVGCYAFGA